MTINWGEIFTALIATVGGGGVILAAVAWLLKEIISNRLAKDAEKFKAQIKADADIQIERVKASLILAGNLHGRQVEILTKLYKPLREAQWFFQRITSAGKLAGEPSDEEYSRLLSDALKLAIEVLSDGRLLLPAQLAHQCDQFFDALFEGRQHLAFAKDPMIIDGFQRAELWKKAGGVAYEKVPDILDQIEKAARKITRSEGLST